MVYLVVREYRKYKEVKLESQDKVAAEIKREYVRTAERLSQTDISFENDSVLERGQFDDAKYVGLSEKEYYLEKLKDTYRGFAETQQEAINKLGKLSNPSSLEFAQNEIERIQTEIENSTDWDSLNKQLSDIKEAVSNVKEFVSKEVGQIYQELSQEQQEFFDRAEISREIYPEMAEKLEGDLNNLEEGKNPVEPEEIIEP